MALSANPKPNHLRLNITVHRRPHSREVAVSYTDGNGIQHRTPFAKNQKAAETKLKEWARGVTGLGFINFVVNAEQLEQKEAK
jgi:hypothetical protein